VVHAQRHGLEEEAMSGDERAAGANAVMLFVGLFLAVFGAWGIAGIGGAVLAAGVWFTAAAILFIAKKR
jgi:hypothetical protein